MNLPNGLVLDTSIWINLLATGRIWEIVTALGASCSTPEQVAGEVLRDPVAGSAFPSDQHPLRGRSELEIVTLGGRSLELFLDLVSGNVAQGLGDGEAAAIALAVVRGSTVALDERKARRVLRERFPTVPMIMSIELLSHPNVVSYLGVDDARASIDRAMQFGRMHVPADWVSRFG